jgi:hypothetical protein
MQQNIGESAQKVVNQWDKNISERPTWKIGLPAVLLIAVCETVSAAHWPAAPAAGNDELANQIRKRLELYRQNVNENHF